MPEVLSSIGPERWKRLEALFDAALELEEERRAAYLDESCARDPDLRTTLERLLRESDTVEGFLARPATVVCSGLLSETPTDEDAGLLSEPPTVEHTRIGPYRLLSEAGRGGMATVYMAERADGEYRKRVALKVVRAGLGLDDHPARRFREERQILASLDHPHIARLLDGGVTPDGTPWFAMEHVEGIRMDRYADAGRLTVEQRLSLFLQVCEAVQYAHRNLVVHRDLKPSNILVTGSGEVKLLDFGIAKLLAERDVAPGLTWTGLRPLTLAYASPEQVRSEPITVSSDVYSLGVVLYELLAGRHPYPRSGRTWIELERAILEHQPEPPSTTAARAGAETASARSTTPERLRRQIRGDLDMTVLMALRKEPERRYPSVEALAADIRRHLDRRPITARPDSTRYRASKFVRRHPVGVGLALAFLVIILGSGILMTTQSARTARERDKAEHLAEFLVGLFQAPDPYRGQGEAVTARELLDAAVLRIDRELADQPETRADLLLAMGRSYEGLGLLDQSRRALESAVELRRQATGADSRLAEDLALLGKVALNQGDFAAAESLGRTGLDIARRLYEGRHPKLVGQLLSLGQALASKGRWDEAESLYREALAIQRERPPEDVQTLAETLHALSHLRALRGDLAEAEALLREALGLMRSTVGDEHPAVGKAYIQLGRLLKSRGDASAEAAFRRGIEIQKRALGDRSPHVATGMAYLAEMLADRGDLAPAESLYRATLAAQRSAHPSGSQFTAFALAGLGRVLVDRGDHAAAEPVLREAIAWHESKGSPAWQYAGELRRLGSSLAAQARYGEAERLLVRSLEARSAQWGEEHELTRDSARALVALYEAWGKPEKAGEFRARALPPDTSSAAIAGQRSGGR